MFNKTKKDTVERYYQSSENNTNEYRLSNLNMDTGEY